MDAGQTTEMGSTKRGSEGAARSFFEDFVFRFLGCGVSSVAFLFLHFLASASAGLVFFYSEAAVGTLGFELVMLAGKTM